MAQYSVTVRGEVINFRDDLTDREAGLLLQARIGNRADASDFEKSILWSYMHTVMTPGRVAWLHYLVSEENQRRKATAVATDATKPKLEGSKLMELFAKVKATGLKTPKVFLALGEGDAVQSVKLSVAPMHGKNPGFLYVTIDADYLGKVSPQGVFTTARPLAGKDDALVALLNKFAADPEGTAKEFGRITSRCCFCGLELSTRPSIWNGYGETCAGNYGLPYAKPPDDWHPVEVVKKAIEGDSNGER